jgi:ribosomal protein S19
LKIKLLSQNFKYKSSKPIYKRITNLIRQHKVVDIYTYQRGNLITPNCVGKRCGVYNGYAFNSFLISKEMVGFKFGAFAQTKKTGKQIHIKKTKKKKSILRK